MLALRSRILLIDSSSRLLSLPRRVFRNSPRVELVFSMLSWAILPPFRNHRMPSMRCWLLLPDQRRHILRALRPRVLRASPRLLFSERLPVLRRGHVLARARRQLLPRMRAGIALGRPRRDRVLRVRAGDVRRRRRLRLRGLSPRNLLRQRRRKVPVLPRRIIFGRRPARLRRVPAGLICRRGRGQRLRPVSCRAVPAAGRLKPRGRLHSMRPRDVLKRSRRRRLQRL